MLELLQIASKVANINADKYRKSIIGAVAIRKDGVLVSGRNISIKDRVLGKNITHAETRVLRKSGFGSTVYVARILRNGNLAMAKPCCFCMAALKARGVKIVYYTISDTEWKAIKL